MTAIRPTLLISIIATAVAQWSAPAFAAEHVFADAGCTLLEGEIGTVARITSPVTLDLEGGLSVRLAGLMPLGNESEAVAWLEGRLLGAEVALRYGEIERDRYGQAFAQLYVRGEGGESEAWIQAELVAAGHAIVAGFPEERSCLAALLAFERDARAQRVGVWSARTPISAWSPLLRDVPPRYELIEGRVVSLGRTDRTVYLNFGNNWSIDLTVTIDVADVVAFEGEGAPLDTLVGREVRIRGWLEQWDGPWIRIDYPEQIEVLDQSNGEGGSG